MTAWQNQPPLSRRQARDSARLQGSADVTPETPSDETPTPAPNVTPGSGRRVQWDPSSEPAEPLTYMTQARIPVDGPTVGAPPAADAPTATSAVPESVESRQGSQDTPTGYRQRDYRPERRSSFAPAAAGAAEPWSPPSVSGGAEVPTDGEPLAGGSAQPKADGWNRPLPSDLAAPERTMTRRELRMLRERALAEGEPEPSVVFGPEGVAVTTSTIGIVRPDDGHGLDESSDVAVEPEADAAGVVTEVPVDVERASGVAGADADPDLADPDRTDAEVVEPEVVGPEIVGPEVVEPEIVAVVQPDPVIPALIDPSTDAGAAERSSIAEPASAGTGPAAAAEPEIVVAELVDEKPVSSSRPPATVSASGEMRRPVVPASEAIFAVAPDPAPPVVSGVDESSAVVSTATPPPTPFGHWSTQGDNQDSAAAGDTALSRNVGVSTGAITTHALVLPSIPESGDQLLTPLTQTGEIMVTGSIDLPRSFGSTGAHPALFDHPDVDAIIDEADRDDTTAESAPVRAVRAVASNSSARAVIEAPAPRKSRLPAILGIVGGAVLLAAIVVIVTVFVINGV